MSPVDPYDNLVRLLNCTAVGVGSSFESEKKMKVLFRYPFLFKFFIPRPPS
jgi:hypothetical protein